MGYHRIATAKVDKASETIEGLAPRLSLYEAIRELAPSIEAKAAQNVSLKSIYQVTAKSLGCSADAVSRAYRKVRLERSKRKKG